MCKICVWSQIGRQPTFSLPWAVAFKNDPKSSQISEEGATLFCLLRTWHCNTPPRPHHHSYPCNNDYSRNLTHATDCRILFIRTTLQGFQYLVISAQSLHPNFQRRAVALPAPPANSILLTSKIRLPLIYTIIYSSILTTASSEHYIIKGSLAEKLPIYKQDRRVEQCRVV